MERQTDRYKDRERGETDTEIQRGEIRQTETEKGGQRQRDRRDRHI